MQFYMGNINLLLSFSIILFYVLYWDNILPIVSYESIQYFEIKLYLNGHGSCGKYNVAGWIFIQVFSPDDHKYCDILKKCS